MKANLTKISCKAQKRDSVKKRLDETAKTLVSHQTMARASFLALIAMVLYLSSITYNTTHHDLLLNTKVSVLWSAVELPRRWVFGAGSVILVVLVYEAISLHHRLDRQFRVWFQGLPTDELARNSHIIWLHGSLTTDIHDTTDSTRWLSRLAKTIVYTVLWISPLLTLVFIQAVVMPVHSEWLSSTVRLSLLCTCFIVASSIRHDFRDHSLRNTETPKTVTTRWFYALRKYVQRPMNVLGSTVTAGVLFFSWLVFLWPGERLQVWQSRIAPKSLLWSYEDYGKREGPTFLRLPCTYCTYFREAMLGWTIVLRSICAAGSTRCSPTYQLANTTINGAQLSAQERYELGAHSSEKPLHENFFMALRKINTLDLSEEDVRYADFSHAFAPKVIFSKSLSRDVAFQGAQLQGATFFINSSFAERVNILNDAVDLSNATIEIDNEDPLPPIHITAVNSDIFIKGPMPGFTNGDLRFARIMGTGDGFEGTVRLPKTSFNALEHFKKHTISKTFVHSTNLSGAVLQNLTLVNAHITRSRLVGASLLEVFFAGDNLIEMSDFSLGRLELRRPHDSLINLTPGRVTWNYVDMNLASFDTDDVGSMLFFNFTGGTTNHPALSSLASIERERLRKGVKKPADATLISPDSIFAQPLNSIGPTLLNSRFPHTSQNRFDLQNYWLFTPAYIARVDRNMHWDVSIGSISKCSLTKCDSQPRTLRSTARAALKYLCEKYPLYLSNGNDANIRDYAYINFEDNELIDASERRSNLESKQIANCRRDIHGNLLTAQIVGKAN
jgi:uncharacterized protein YjbI with pentapeptide repeats